MISGTAYGNRATIDVAGDTVTWRAHRDTVAENIATTTHDLRAARFTIRRWSRGGLVLVIAAAVVSSHALVAAILAGAGLVLMLHRLVRPTHTLRLDLGDRWLVLRLDGRCEQARQLAARIPTEVSVGSSPPTLP